ncbi:putrescine aminopropyltransferase (spermidine synthase) [Gracilaria domingensis]|nr:putrescine aminopropyltransferase (spermidine synthase) [Gracilaria domingensis]
MERGSLWPGQAMSLEVEEVLEHFKSKYQEVLVFKSKSYGNVLVLDGVIQCTERDEFAYQEMIAHIPLFSHPNPENVLIVGGGDGGVMREVLKHPSVKKIVLCEIDEKVIEVSKKYLPSMALSFSSERTEVLNMDGLEFMKGRKEEFDVIITDSSDPIGPAETLFGMEYYEIMHQSLKPGGLICSQGECMWLHANLIQPLIWSCRRLYAVVEYAYTTIPTYPSGQIGFILCSKDENTKFRVPLRKPMENMMEKLRYYNTEIHSAAFVLPNFARKAILS